MIAELSWAANAESDLSHYVLYWGTVTGVYSSQRLETETRAFVPDLPDRAPVYFAVTAVDNSGNESGFSTEVSKTNKRVRIRIS